MWCDVICFFVGFCFILLNASFFKFFLSIFLFVCFFGFIQGKKKGNSGQPSVGPFAGVEPWVYFNVSNDQVKRMLEEVLHASFRFTVFWHDV